MADWLEIGVKAPPFTLSDQAGRKVKLSGFRGMPVAIYFYPKDDTPGCTREACDFRDSHQQLKRMGAQILGISPDDQQAHAHFAKKHRLSFPILSDTEHKVAMAYGAWREKSSFGRTVMGIQRSTYLIDRQGRVARVWRRVQVDGHVQQVIAALNELFGDGA